MKLPDILIVGAQKIGTTTLFVLLSKHPQLFLPARKELQFFSNHEYHAKGLEWYSNEFFARCPEGHLAGEVSPQYMSSTQVARRVHDGLPNAKNIAILRNPIDRAYSQYRMACRREQETRSPGEAFAAAALTTEEDVSAPVTARYLQFSDYERMLTEYLSLYGRKNMLILFQEGLDRDPAGIMRKVCAFLGVREIIPENLGVRVHRSGDVRFNTLSKLTRTDNLPRRILRSLVPRKLRPTIMFWTEMLNIRPKDVGGTPKSLLTVYESFSERQIAFIEKEFGETPPWAHGDAKAVQAP